MTNTMTFEQIYKKHQRIVFNVINKIVRNTLDAEELTSETMIRVHKSLPTYREDLAKLSTWIINIAKNAAIDHVRRKRVQTVALEDVYVDWANGDESAQTDHLIALKSTEGNPEEKMIEDEVRKVMNKNFDLLNPTDKAVATLHYFDGLSYDEVATELNMPLGTVKAKIHKARVQLMEAFPVEMRRLATIQR
jgi:RNA polymerase sigma factor (sigma-70 family)